MNFRALDTQEVFHIMGSGLTTLSWLPEKVDEDTCRGLCRDMEWGGEGGHFDYEAYLLLADPEGLVNKDQLVHWTMPLDDEERAYFQEQLACENRVEFLKKFKPIVKSDYKESSYKFLGGLRALQQSKKMLRAHKAVPPFVKR